MWLFGLVLACGAVSVELTRRSGEPGGVDRDVYAIWDLPAAVLLPPVYVMLVPIPRMLLTQARRPARTLATWPCAMTISRCTTSSGSLRTERARAPAPGYHAARDGATDP